MLNKTREEAKYKKGNLKKNHQANSSIKKRMVIVKVSDVKNLFHLRLDFFVEQMRENKWHLEKRKALINANVMVDSVTEEHKS